MSDSDITASNIYQEIPKRDPNDSDLLRHADEVQGVAIRLQNDVGGPYKLGAVNGKIWWFLGSDMKSASSTRTPVAESQGAGDITKQGAGFFRGNIPSLPDDLLTGNYDLDVTATTATLTLSPPEPSNEAYVFNGTGVQRGVSGTWHGTWTRTVSPEPAA